MTEEEAFALRQTAASNALGEVLRGWRFEHCDGCQAQGGGVCDCELLIWFVGTRRVACVGADLVPFLIALH